MSSHLARLVLWAAGLAMALAPGLGMSQGAPQQPAPALNPASEVQPFKRVALSSNGQFLAYIVEQDGADRLELASWRGTDRRTIPLAAGCQPQDIAWQRRSLALAILAHCSAGGAGPLRSSIELLEATGSAPPRVVATFDGFAHYLRWMPDNSHLAFLYAPGATRVPAGRGAMPGQRVAAIAASGGQPEIWTPADLDVTAYTFAPLRRPTQLAYTAVPANGGDAAANDVKLYLQAGGPGTAPRVLVDPATVAGPLHGQQIALPRWTTRENILFIGGSMQDIDRPSGDIYRVPVGGGKPFDLTSNSGATFGWFEFNLGRLLVSRIEHGEVHVARYVFSSPASLRQTALYFTVPTAIGNGRAPMGLALSDHRDRVAYIQNGAGGPAIHSGVLRTQPPPATITPASAP